LVRRLAVIALLGTLVTLATALSAAAIVFKPTALPGGQVGVRYEVVIRVSIAGHHPALGKDYPSYTVACYGADKGGGYMDDCAKLPPGLRLVHYEGPGCAPPLSRPDCVALVGKPRKAGRYSFRISAPDVNSVGVRGILRRYTVVIRPPA
jgi:hypothetical protein